MNKKVIFFCLLIVISACTKRKGCTDPVSISFDEEAEVNDGSCVYGGEGGQNSVKYYLYSQQRAVISKPDYRDSVFIKYNATTPPGSNTGTSGGNQNSYDKMYLINVGDSAINITGL